MYVQLSDLDEIACLTPAPDGSGLAQWGGVSQAVAMIASTAIQAGATVGAAAISANASKYAIKQQTKADLQIALARQQAELKALEAQAATQRESQEQETARTTERSTATQNIIVTIAPYIGIGAIGVGILVIALKPKAQQYYPFVPQRPWR
jgi:hypothetical protein